MYSDALFFDDWEELPGGWSTQCRQIKRFYEGKDFFIEDDTKEGKERRLKIDVDWTTYLYYFEVWENWNQFNLLPNGGNGWLDEVPWVLDFIKHFNRVYNEIEAYRLKKR